MKSTLVFYTRLGFLLCAITVALGALGSHFLRERLTEKDILTFDTGIRYQFFHALALTAFGLVGRKLNKNKLELAMGFFVIGITLFSGSLYLLATRELWGGESYGWIGALTPFGGISFIAGWLILFIGGISPDEQTEETHHRRHRRSHRDGGAEQNDERKLQSHP